jgi:transposase
MAQNFIESRREQGFLLTPDVRDWLAADHLAWFVIDAVAEMDLAAFYGAYRADGHGRAAYEPSMMVTLLMYAYATRVRSSRAIEGHCRQDVAYRVITGNLVPDHATVARFVVRHEAALAELFGEVLGLCDRAGLVKPGLVAIDGTRMAGNASPDANHQFQQIAREVLAEHKATDEAEDEQFGEARGDELPEQLRTSEGRREFLRNAKRKLRDGSEVDGSGETEPAASPDPEYEFDPERILARTQGRKGWLCDAERQLEQHRWQNPDSVSRSRSERLLLTAERLEADLGAQRAGNEAFERHRVTGRDAQGRRLAGTPTPYQPPEVPDGKVNVTDPDSKHIKASVGYVQGYNAQAVVDQGQIVLAAEITNSTVDWSQLDPMITNSTVDWSQLDPMITATLAELERSGVSGRPEIALADTQYWNEQHMDAVVANKHVQVLIPPDNGTSGKQRTGWTGGRYTWMRYVLATQRGDQLYRKRKQMDRARVRSHPAQQRSHTVPAKRPHRRAHRVAITDGNPQPHQALPPPDRHRGRLKRPPRRSHRRSGRVRQQHDIRRPAPPPTAKTFERQPRREAAVSAAGSSQADAAAAERIQS